MKVYVAHDGEYSDRHIVAVCSTHEKAEYVQNTLYCMGEAVEEWELDAEPSHDPALLPYEVAMDREGSAPRVERIPMGEALLYCWAGMFRIPHDCMEFQMLARSPEHAVKIAGERRRTLIAENLWTTDKDEFARWCDDGKIDPWRCDDESV